jgi:hypothetical protein
MTKDDIDKLWNQAMTDAIKNGEDFTRHRFANLVAAAEREAIAQMFEASPELISFAQNDQGGCIICGLNPKIAAKAIRARGNT